MQQAILVNTLNDVFDGQRCFFGVMLQSGGEHWCNLRK
jgi:hypothetical protein